MLRLHVEEQVGLDQLQALVDERGGIDRHHRPHVPGRVSQRLLRAHPTQLVARTTAERPARSSQHQVSDLRAPRHHRRRQTALVHARSQGLRDRRVLRIHRHDLPRETHRVLHQRAAHDQRLLVRQRQAGAAAQRRERRRQPHATRNAVEDHGSRARIQLLRTLHRSTHDLDRGVLADEHLRARAAHRLHGSSQFRAHVSSHTDERGIQGKDLRGKLGDRRTASAHTQHVETAPVRFDDLAGLRADRAGRAQQNNGDGIHPEHVMVRHQSTASKISIARPR